MQNKKKYYTVKSDKYKQESNNIEEQDSIDTQNKECNNCCKSENTQLQTLYNEMKEQLNCFDERLKIIDADLKVLNVKDAEKSKILNSIDDLYSHNIKTIEKETNEVLEQLKEKVANINNEITQSTQALKSQDKEQTDLSKRIETIENVLNEAIDLKCENEVLKNEINKLKTDLRDLTQVHSVTREIALENQNKSLWQIIKDRI